MRHRLIAVVILFSIAGTLYLARKEAVPEVKKASLDLSIEEYRSRIRENPDEAKNYSALGSQYLQKVRETADTSYYAEVEKLAASVESLEPDSPDALYLRAVVALGRHHFSEAIERGRSAIAARPETALYYGILADGYIETGEYAKAEEALEAMMRRRPDYSAYTRVAYLRELHGDFSGVQEALETAIESGALYAENSAWAYVELGKLHFADTPASAAPYFMQALAFVPEYPAAFEGLGKVALMRGDYNGALEHFRRAFKLLPVAHYAEDLGDAYVAKGDSRAAEQQYAIAQIAYQSSYANGVNSDMEYARFLADHDLDLPLALQKARAAYKEGGRKSVHGADVLAWALYKNGMFGEARQYSLEALRLGENDPTILLHAGLIAEKGADAPEAKRLLEKSFSLYSYVSPLSRRAAEDALKNL